MSVEASSIAGTLYETTENKQTPFLTSVMHWLPLPLQGLKARDSPVVLPAGIPT